MPKNRIMFLAGAIALFLLGAGAEAARRTVPVPYSSIQAAINAAVNGDTVLVEDGDYFENVNFSGKNIFVASYFLLDGDFEHVENTTIDAADSGAVVIFENSESRNARLVGFTITGGAESGILCTGEIGQAVYPTISFCIIDANYSPSKGGGIFCEYASPWVNNCWIINNEAEDGAGVYLNYQGSHPFYPEFYNCEITDNLAFNGCGGGIYTTNNDARFVNCLIADNDAENEEAKLDGDGGGMYITDSYWSTYSKLENCTFTGNNGIRGGGLFIAGGDSNPIIKNCIFWGNSAEAHDDGPDIYMTSSPYATISWCSVHPDSINQNSHLTWEGFNLSGDPRFIGGGDYHLSSTSPCIDSGNYEAVYNDPEHSCYPGMAKPLGLGTTRNDIGAYGGPGADDWYAMKLFVDPLELDFGLVPIDEDSTMVDSVFNLGIYSELEMEICSVQSSNPVFTAEALDSLVGAGEAIEIEITFEPTAVGEENAAITILTSDGSQIVSLTGYGSGPVLAVSPDTVDFGVVVVGGEKVDTLYVLNEGTDTLEVSEVSCESSVFEAEDNTPFAVGPGESEPVAVTFAPEDLQREQAFVIVITDAGEDSVILSGQGGPLAAIRHLMAMLIKPDLLLKWEPIQGATYYLIYRHTEPLFIPSPEDTLATTTSASFVDSAAAGNPVLNYYYLVFSANDLIQSPPSNRVGEVDRNLINGSLRAISERPTWQR